MLSLTRRILVVTIGWSVAAFLWAGMKGTRDFLETVDLMDQIIASGNKFCVSQTQDIDLVMDKINETQGSRSAYSLYLNALRSYSGIEGYTATKYSANGRYVSSTERDPILCNDIIPFLQRDLGSVTGTIGYTPLNFGLTYLDPLLMQEEMKTYIQRYIREFDVFLRYNTMTPYKVDPNTIDVKCTLQMRPIRIDNLLSDPEAHLAYLQLFGIDAPDPRGDKGIKRNQIKTIIKYDIVYTIKWDYIPESSFWRVPAESARNQSTGSKPPAHLYFPQWYDKDGRIETDADVRYSNARLKYINPEGLEYKFSYVMTH